MSSVWEISASIFRLASSSSSKDRRPLDSISTRVPYMAAMPDRPANRPSDSVVRASGEWLIRLPVNVSPTAPRPQNTPSHRARQSPSNNRMAAITTARRTTTVDTNVPAVAPLTSTSQHQTELGRRKRPAIGSRVGERVVIVLWMTPRAARKKVVAATMPIWSTLSERDPSRRISRIVPANVTIIAPVKATNALPTGGEAYTGVSDGSAGSADTNRDVVSSSRRTRLSLFSRPNRGRHEVMDSRQPKATLPHRGQALGKNAAHHPYTQFG